MDHPVIEYCRFTAPARELSTRPALARERFASRAGAHGGTLYGCWRSLTGLGLARDEGLALTAFATAHGARAAAPVAGAEHHVLQATVRPTDDTLPAYDGVYVFRWFQLAEAHWPAFRDLSNAAWPNMESVFDVNIVGLWLSLDATPPRATALLLTRYADLSVWEASRWWRKPVAAADESMRRFRERNEIIDATVAYPGLLIAPG